MKRWILIVILLAVIVGGIYFYSKSTAAVGKAVEINLPQPAGNSNSDVNVCIGSAEYCSGVGEAEILAVQAQNDQYRAMLTQTAPTPVPTLSVDSLAIQQRDQRTKSDAENTALWAGLVIVCLVALCFLVFQMYWGFRVKIPRDEVAPGIHQKGGLIVARLKADPDHANVQDQFVVVDQRSWGTMMVHIDGNGIAKPIAVSDEVGRTLALGHALERADSRGHAQAVMKQLLEEWSGASRTQIEALGNAAAKWRSAGSRSRERRQSESRRLLPGLKHRRREPAPD